MSYKLSTAIWEFTDEVLKGTTVFGYDKQRANFNRLAKDTDLSPKALNHIYNNILKLNEDEPKKE